MYVVHCRKGPAGAGRGRRRCYESSVCYEMLLVDVMFIKDVCVIIT